MTKPLLDDDEQFLPEVETALMEIFKRFDMDADNLLSISELQNFATKTNGKPFTQEAIEEISTYFDMDGDKLTKKGFYEMYHMQTTGEEEETRKDLVAHGFVDYIRK